MEKAKKDAVRWALTNRLELAKAVQDGVQLGLTLASASDGDGEGAAFA